MQLLTSNHVQSTHPRLARRRHLPRRRRNYPFKRHGGARLQAKSQFMSAPEQRLDDLLRQSLPDYHVFAQQGS